MNTADFQALLPLTLFAASMTRSKMRAAFFGLYVISVIYLFTAK
jgi:hypothetical protein